MSQLHAYYNLRQQQSFQKLLNEHNNRGQSATGNSGGRSWNRPSTLNAAMACDVNAKDWLGRTVLHLACASADPSSLEFVRLLLAHPGINVNVADTESHWTALHRALFNGNIAAAVFLLKRADTDATLKDFEGYTAFDLYNSTLNTTKPEEEKHAPADLFTWGANRNAALGLGDGNDRVHPEQVNIKAQECAAHLQPKALDERLAPIRVQQIAMSRLHTVVVTSENSGNIRICGFGSGGRLGPGQHTQYSLTPIPHFTHVIASVALGQDHTLAVTKAGEVFSWGLNRFSQLGYILDSPANAGAGGIALRRSEEPIQASPRKILGPLKKEVVQGLAACKTASACWTADDVYTWGTNHGQLGYDKVAQPVQVFPRKVTKIAERVLDLSITDTAMTCLLQTHEVICIWNDRYAKINFPTHSFPAEIHQAYRPPQAIRDARIGKLTSCDDTFAALSVSGEVFTFSVPSPSDLDAVGRERATIKPQRVWALRKQFSGVRDVALGLDGALIVATQSGHVFIRSRNSKGGQSSSAKTFKFQRVHGLQRVIGVCANNTGAFGALRVDYKPKPIVIPPEGPGQHMAAIRPFLQLHGIKSNGVNPSDEDSGDFLVAPALHSKRTDDGADAFGVAKDIRELQAICKMLSLEKGLRFQPSKSACPLSLNHGANIIVQSDSGPGFPVHRVWLAARSPVLRRLFSASSTINDVSSKITIRIASPLTTSSKSVLSSMPRLLISGCCSMSILILLSYLYTDEVLTIWDHRVATTLEQSFSDLKVIPAHVRLSLLALARILELQKLAEVAQKPEKYPAKPTLQTDLQCLAGDGQIYRHEEGLVKDSTSPDVFIQLKDRTIASHSLLLRARSPFFAALFDDVDWTVKRWDANGILTIDMAHLDWQIMKYPFRFMCCGLEDEKQLFSDLEAIQTVDSLLEMMFDIMAAADELLLYRLVLLCSSTLLKHLSTFSACYILSDAVHFNNEELTYALLDYVTATMETHLEGKMLDDLDFNLIKQLSLFVRNKQAATFRASRSNTIYASIMERHKDWLVLQDIPQTIVRSLRASSDQSPKLSPTSLNKGARRLSNRGSPTHSPLMRPLSMINSVASHGEGDEIFAMDDGDLAHMSPSLVEPVPLVQLSVGTHANSSPVWKRASLTPKKDMKTIMAEAERSRATEPKVPLQRMVVVGKTQKDRTSIIPGSPDRSNNVLAGSNNSPWKIAATTSSSIAFPAQLTTSGASLGVTSIGTPSAQANRPHVTELTERKNDGGRSPMTQPSTTSSPAKVAYPTLGPVFVPLRQSSSGGPSGIKRVPSEGAAWTSSSLLPASDPFPSGIKSFVAIQQLQHDEGLAPEIDKRSMREIQEEEQARQAEDDFLKWWAAEEGRVKNEAEAMQQQPQPPLRKLKTPRKRPTAHKSSSGISDSRSESAASRSTAQPTADRGKSRSRKPSPPITGKAGQSKSTPTT